MGRNVTLSLGGHVIYPRTRIDNIEGAAGGMPTGGGTTTVSSVKYASSAGVLTANGKSDVINSAIAKVSNVTYAVSAGIAQDLIETVKANIIDSAVASVPVVTSVLSATSAEIAYGLDDTIKAAIITSATPSPITSVASAGLAESITDELKNLIITSAITAVPDVSSVVYATSANIASGIIDTVKSDIIDSAVAAVPVDTSYHGPFKCSIANVNSVTVGTGAMYLGGTETNIAMSTIASSTGTVYFYCYYANNNYIHGVEIASSAAALTSAAVVTGSAGFYKALADVTEYGVNQRHFGDIIIEGRIQ